MVKNIAVLRAKKSLMAILIEKMHEYCKNIDSEQTGDIIFEIAK